MNLATEVLELAGKIKADMETKGNEALVQAEKDPYYGNLPENLTKENVDDTHTYDRVFLAASTKAIGDLGVEGFMQKDKDIKIFTGTVNMGTADKGRHNTNAVTMQRDYEVRVPSKDGQTTTKVKPLHTVSSYTVVGRCCQRKEAESD